MKPTVCMFLLAMCLIVSLAGTYTYVTTGAIDRNVWEIPLELVLGVVNVLIPYQWRMA